jgi:hypothetical protein
MGATIYRMVDSVISAKGIIIQLDKHMRHCLWRARDLTKHNPPLPAWSMVCKLKNNKGGMRIIGLQGPNDCLLMKHIFLTHVIKKCIFFIKLGE